MIDTHCHLDTAAFDDDREAVIVRAAAAGVVGMLVPAIRPRTWLATRALAARHAALGVRCAIGVHPQIVPELDDAELEGDLVARIAAAAGDAIAIGECGLDGKTGERDRQEAILRAHVRAARELGKPLVVHVLGAHDRAVTILREEGATEVGGVLHSYSGGAGLVNAYRRLGFAFSFAGPVTYANARRPIEAARAVPAELLLVETDAPDQTPDPHRGGRNEPAFVAAVLRGLAAARDTAVSDLAAVTTANARRIFRSW